jgi:hypothetical protein
MDHFYKNTTESAPCLSAHPSSTTLGGGGGDFWPENEVVEDVCFAVALTPAAPAAAPWSLVRTSFWLSAQPAGTDVRSGLRSCAFPALARGCPVFREGRPFSSCDLGGSMDESL